jgi:predicted metal-dependent phosphoesterase TrpH
MKSADLHFHTKCSDGKHSIGEVVQILEKARSTGLALAVLTDHDGIEGFEEFSSLVQKWWTPVCASEISCSFTDPVTKKNRELHLLMYGISPLDSFLTDKLKNFKEERLQRFRRICEKLAAAGITVDAERIITQHQGALGRPHIADALVAAGHATSRADAFDRYLYDGSPYNVEKWRFSVEDALAWAQKKGYKTSIAHPGQYHFSEPHLQYFKDCGVSALEVVHPRHSAEDQAYYRRQATRLGLSVSGGSDFHAFESDSREGVPSLGRTQYSLDEAKAFLGSWL